MILGHETVGTGARHVMVLHGWFGDHGVWKTTYPLLDTKAFTYVFPDWRGYGASRDNAGHHDMGEMAGDVLALADALGWQRFGVIGHSMGGKAAQRLAMDAPARVVALVGVNPVPPVRLPLSAELVGIFEAVPVSDDAARGIIGASLGMDRPDTAALVEKVLQMQRGTTDSAAAVDYFHAFAEEDFSGDAHELSCPTLLLAGQHDGGVSPEMMKAVYPSLYPHARIDVLADAGHYPMLEIPSVLISVMEEFLSEAFREHLDR